MSCPVPDVVHWNVTEPPGHMVPVGDVSRVVAMNVKKFKVDFQNLKNYSKINFTFKDLPSEACA